MTTPRQQIARLAGAMEFWADEADRLDAAGRPHAALAAQDQALAAEAHAEKIARENGISTGAPE